MLPRENAVAEAVAFAEADDMPLPKLDAEAWLLAEDDAELCPPLLCAKADAEAFAEAEDDPPPNVLLLAIAED
jgi:hypothetical protein